MQAQHGSGHARGFTLIEVMVVVVILGLLAAIIVPRVMSRPDEARAVAARADIAAINQALKLYRLDNTFYPSTEQGLAALVQRPTTQPVPGNWKQGGYLDRVPKDPWGREYQYRPAHRDRRVQPRRGRCARRRRQWRGCLQLGRARRPGSPWSKCWWWSSSSPSSPRRSR
jgi:type II secretion system protein G